MGLTRDKRNARADRLEGWAGKREAKAEAGHDRADALASVIPFGQPILAGHHSEARDTRYRARIATTMDRAIADSRKAIEMRSKARNIRCAADRAIYSDDENAVEALADRIAGLELERDAWKAYNAACRKAGRPTPEAVQLLSESQQRTLESMANARQIRSNGAAPAYATSNLSGNIKRNRDRLAALLSAQPEGDTDMTSTTDTTTAAPAIGSEVKSGRVKARTDITYWHDGRPMPGNHSHKLSTLAYFHSGNISDDKPTRLSTKEFVAVLASLGVLEAGQPGWMVELPNGITVECRLDGEKSEYSGPVAPRKSTSSKASKSAKKSTKSTAKRNGSTRSSSKIPPSMKAGLDLLKDALPEKSTAKKATAKKSTAKKAAPAKKATAARKSTAKRTAPAMATSSSDRAKEGVAPRPKKSTGSSSKPVGEPGPRSLSSLLP